SEMPKSPDGGSFYLDKVAPGRFVMKGPTHEDQTRDLLRSLQVIGAFVLKDEGHLAKWRELLASKVADSSYFAARLVDKTYKINRALGRIGVESDVKKVRRHAFEAIHLALACVFEMHSLDTTENEVEIDSGIKSAAGASAGGRAKSTLERDREFVKE